MVKMTVMRPRFSFVVFFLFAMAETLFAGAEKKTYEQAMKAGGKDGAVVYVYGPDWEGVGGKMLDKLFKNKNVRNACGNAGLVAIPVYQRPNEKQKKEAAAAGKGFRATRKIRSYPALVLKGADGNDYYTICGDEILQEPEKVAALMKEKFELYKKQSEILKKVGNTKGLARAKIFAEACNIEGIYSPPDAENLIRECDPELKDDACARAVFDVYKLITDRTHASDDKKAAPVKVYTNEEVIARLKSLTAGERYTPRQKQELYLAATGLLRRNRYDGKELRRLWAEMVELDPESVLAKYAQNSAKIYTGEALPKTKTAKTSDAAAGTRKPKK